MSLASRLPRVPWRPRAIPLAVVQLETATDPKRRARVQAASLHHPGSGHLQADLFRLAWRRQRAVRPNEPDDPPTVRAPAEPPLLPLADPPRPHGCGRLAGGG